MDCILFTLFGFVATIGVAFASEHEVGRVHNTVEFIVTQDDDRARIDLSAQNPFSFRAEQNNDALTLWFDAPVSGDLSAPVALLPDFFDASYHSDRAQELRFVLVPGVRLIAYQAGPTAFIEVGLNDAVRAENDTDFPLTRADVYANVIPRLKPIRKTGVDSRFANNSPRVQSEFPVLTLATLSPVHKRDVLPIRVFVKEATQMRRVSLNDEFLSLEEKYLSTQNYDDLARLYFGYELYSEAATVLQQLHSTVSKTDYTLILALVLFADGRHQDAIDLARKIEEAEFTKEKNAIIAASLCELGAYKEAAELREMTPVAHTQFGVLRSKFLRAQLEIALEYGGEEDAKTVLRSYQSLALSSYERDDRDLLKAQFSLKFDKPDAALRALDRLSTGAHINLQSEAALTKLLYLFQRGEIDAATAYSQFKKLDLAWSGRRYSTALVSVLADLARDNGDYERAFDVHKRVISRYPASDAAQKSRTAMQKMLASLFAHKEVSPLLSSRLFFENVEWAPPGEKGDQLIDEAISALIDLDLLKEAATILRHQVFERLRGADRAVRATDLASLYLEANAPEDALFVLRSTRFARLSTDIVAQRHLIEAQALNAIGRSDAAIALLEGKPSITVRQAALLGSIHWGRQQWSEAGAAYQVAVGVDDDQSNGLAKADRATFLLRAAASYSLAGQSEKVQSIVASATKYNYDDHVLSILTQLADGTSPTELLAAYNEYFNTVAEKRS